jgi:hypothetical protein
MQPEVGRCVRIQEWLTEHLEPSSLEDLIAAGLNT